MEAEFGSKLVEGKEDQPCANNDARCLIKHVSFVVATSRHIHDAGCNSTVMRWRFGFLSQLISRDTNARLFESIHAETGNALRRILGYQVFGLTVELSSFQRTQQSLRQYPPNQETTTTHNIRKTIEWYFLFNLESR
jgi:hypothetical protein